MNKSAVKNLFKKMFADKEQRHRVIIATTGWIPDKAYLRLLYLFICKKWLSFKNPKTFNEKLQWYKVKHRDPLMVQCADKFAVREYIKQQGLEHMLVPLHGVYEDAAQLDFDALPSKCILKTTHNSSGSYKWNAARENDTEKIRKCFSDMMKINAYWLAREWAYRDISPKIVCEQWIESTTPIVDLKFLCFHGKAQYICYDVGMNDDMGNHAIGHRAMLDRSLQPLDIKTSMQRLADDQIKLPDNMEELITVADQLSSAFPHVRVDFFLADGKAYFSELTFYSGGGYGTFEPKQWDLEIGSHFHLQ